MTDLIYALSFCMTLPSAFYLGWRFGYDKAMRDVDDRGDVYE